jgi:hypothetical protein
VDATTEENFRSHLAGTLAHRFHSHSQLLLGITLAALTLLAWFNRFIQDDAFISFRYAENLINGNGLVWNIGERIEGYTNFLWVIIIAAGMRTGIEPIAFSYILGMIFFPVTLYLFFRLCRSIFDSDIAGYIGVILLGSNYTFSAYATGGLETHFLALLLVAVAAISTQNFISGKWSLNSLLTLSFLLGGAILTRLDAVIPCGIFTLFIITNIIQTSRRRESITKLATLFFPAAIIILLWVVWKLNYYGSILPNSFYAKTAFGSSFETGGRYLHRFFTSYLLYPVLAILIYSLKSLMKTGSISLRMTLCFIIAWMLYVASVGGDFMEFRFMVTVLPFLTLLILWLAFRFFNKVSLAVLLIGIIVGGNIHHIMTFSYDTEYEIESRDMLQGHLYNKDEQWINAGKTLGEAFKEVPEATFAVTTAGAVPFYSKLFCIDMLGLNDTFVTRQGMFLSNRPGHQRIAPVSYLLKRKVNFVISQPTVVPMKQPPTIIPFLPRYPNEPLPDARLIEIPLDTEYKIFIWYLTPTLRINGLIQQKGWKAFKPTPHSRG